MSSNVNTLSNYESTADLQNHVLKYLKDTISCLTEENEKLKDKNMKLEEKVNSGTQLNEQLLHKMQGLYEKIDRLERRKMNEKLMKCQLKRFNKMDQIINDLKRKNKTFHIKIDDDANLNQTFVNEIIRLGEEKIEVQKRHEEEIASLKRENKKWVNNFENVLKLGGSSRGEDIECLQEIKVEYAEYFQKTKSKRRRSTVSERSKFLSAFSNVPAGSSTSV